MTTYKRIRDLTIELEEGGGVRKRRAAGEALQRLLSNPDVTRRLRQEALHPSALKEMWRMVIQTVVVSVQKNKKSWNEPDIVMLPLKLTQCCLNNGDRSNPLQPYPLTRKETKMIFRYCMDMLQEDSIPQQLQAQLLHSLATLICANRVFVVYFRPHVECLAILECVEHILMETEENYATRNAAAKVFDQLLKTTAALGMAIHSLVPGCVHFVSKYILAGKDEGSTTTDVPMELPIVLSGLSAILYAHPESCIAPLTRHGRVMLTAVKRAMKTVPSQYRILLVDFIRSYLLVATTAGQLQGLIPGDLGDLAKASLSKRQLALLLDLIYREYEKISIQTTYLDLLARLLAASQRVYMCDYECSLHDDLTSYLIQGIHDAPNPYDHHEIKTIPEPQKLPLKVFADSPFCSYVLKPLYARIGLLDSIDEHSGSSQNTDSDIHMELAQCMGALSSRRENVIPALQILSACCELFPAGECWASSALEGWVHKDGIVNVHTGDAQYLSVIVEAVTKVLIVSTNEPDSVEWALQCLLRLVGASEVLLILNDNDLDFQVVRDAWKVVAETVLRPDLPLLGCSTKDITSNSTGELLVSLLREIMLSRVLSVGFLKSCQRAILDLPVFDCPRSDASVVFQLVASIMQSCGISDDERLERLVTFCAQSLEPSYERPETLAILHCLFCLFGSHIRNSGLLQDCLDRFLLPSYGPTCFTLLQSHEIASASSDTIDEDVLEDDFSRDEDVVELVAHRLRKALLRRRSFQPIESMPRSRSNRILKHMITTINEALREKLNNPEVVEKDKLSMRSFYLGVKVAVVSISREREQEVEVHTLLADISDLFRDVCLTLGDLSSMPLTMDVILGNLLKLISASIDAELTVSDDPMVGVLSENANALFQEFRNILNEYECCQDRGREENTEVAISLVNDDFMDDQISDNDGDETHHMNHLDLEHQRKRGRAEQRSQRAKHRRIERRVPLRFRTGVLLARILVALDPVLSVCEFCLKKLGGEGCLEESASFPQMDPLGCCEALKILCSECVLYRETLEKKRFSPSENPLPSGGTIPILICKAIKAIRSQAQPDSPFFSYFVCLLPRLVRFVDVFRGDPLNSQEADEITELLLLSHDVKEHSTLWNLPRLRARQLSAATHCFQYGGGNLHRSFDKEFPRSFVTPSLGDVDPIVRRHSLDAVQIAVQILPEEKVIESVQKRIPSMSDQAHGEKVAFRRWYADKRLIGEAELESGLKQVWEDLFLSMQYHALSCKERMASVASHEVCRSLLFDLVRGAAYCVEQEIAYFLAITSIANARGCAVVAEFIDAERIYLLHRWLESGLALFELPMTVTCPALMTKILRCAIRDVDLCRLKESAASEFLYRNSSFLVPLVVIVSVGSISQSGLTKEARRTVFESEYMRELCSVFDDRFDDEIVKRILQTHRGDILAAAALCSGLGETNCASDVQRTTNSVLPELTEKKKKNIHRRAIIWILQFGSDWRDVRRNGREVRRNGAEWESTMDETMWHLSQSIYPAVNTDIQHFGVTSFFECLVHAVSWYRKSSTDIQRISRWSSIDVLLRQVRRIGSSDGWGPMQNEVCVRALTDAFVQSSSIRVQEEIASTLVSMIESLICSGERGTPFLLKMLLCSCLIVHNFALSTFIRSFEAVKLRILLLLKRSAGVHAPINVCSVKQAHLRSWTERLDKDEGSQYMSCLQCFSFTAKLFSLILKTLEGSDFRADSVGWIIDRQNVCPHDGELLKYAHANFCLDVLLEEQKGKFKKSSIPAFLKDILKPNRPTLEVYGCFHVASDYSLVTETLQVCDLKEMEQFLTGKRIDSTLDSFQLRPVINALSTLTGDAYPRDVRLAANRCLGCFDLRALRKYAEEFDELVEYDPWVESADKSGILLRTFQAKAVEVLTESLKSLNPDISVLALEALQAAADSKICEELAVLLKRKTSRLIFLELKRTGFGDKRGSVATDKSVKDLKRCWCDEIWCVDEHSGISYESWLTTLVSELLLCNFGSTALKSMSKDPGGFDFFSRAYDVSRVEPRFAETVFPGIIFDLLVNRTVDTNDGSTTEDASKPLAWCFTRLMEFHTASERKGTLMSQQIMRLAIKIIDMLRRVSLCRFVISSKIPGRKSLEMKAQANILDPDPPQMKEAASWQGAPFGTLLNLDGLLVIQACASAGMFEMALFYADLLADCRFGGSTQAFKNLADIFRTNEVAIFSTSLIGLSKFQTVEEDSMLLFKRDAFRWLELLGSTLSEVGETEASRAARQFGEELRSASKEMLDTNTFPQLSGIDQLSILDRDIPRNPMNLIHVTNSLDRLHLRGTLKYFLRGIPSSDLNMLSSSHRTSLQDKWFECQILDSEVSGSLVLDGLWDHSADSLHEYIWKSLTALDRDDFEVSSANLQRAWQLATEAVSSAVSSRPLVNHFFQILERVQALGFLEKKVHQFSSIAELSAVWLSHDSPVQITDALQNTYFSGRVHEIILQSIIEKNRQDQTPFEPMVRVLGLQQWSRYLDHCDRQEFQPADEILQRLQSTMSKYPHLDCLGKGQNGFFNIRLQSALLLERQGDIQKAISLVKQVIAALESYESESAETNAILADAFVQIGKWMAKYKMESAVSILSRYLSKGATLAKKLVENARSEANIARAANAEMELGEFAAALYDTVLARINSVDWSKAGESIEDREKELTECEGLAADVSKRYTEAKRMSSTGKKLEKVEKEYKEIQIYRHLLSKEVFALKEERSSISKSVVAYRHLAMKSMLSALSISDLAESSNLRRHVSRFVSLWFVDEPNDIRGDETELRSIVNEAARRLSTFHFVPLASQLLARIDAPSDSGTQNELQILVQRLCVDHPYHCLVLLLAIANGQKIGTGMSGRGADAYRNNVSGSKADAAARLLRLLEARTESYVSRLVGPYRILVDAYIHLALAPTVEFHRGNTKKISLGAVCKNSSSRLDLCLGRRSKDLDFTPTIITCPPQIRPGCDYGEGLVDPLGSERIASFDGYFAITDGGLHRPKIIVCHGAKGTKFKQLVKGEDELRQDAVMEQLFCCVNGLLHGKQFRPSDGTTRLWKSNALKLRTYNVVPLSPTSGVLEWVEETVPFGDCIADRSSKRPSGVHSRYFPWEWNNNKCRDVLRNAPNEEKTQAFDLICSNHSPSFRFFFVERFGHSAEEWYAARLRYTRSVAVSSIVGHILGIGDRHSSNILMHERSGEVVHIDFGIVFEQGKRLNVPEKVPFRLTQNIVDGMGPTGTEGLFMHAALTTLTALRSNAETLTTILSAIVADPLYQWSVSPVKARQRQMMDDNIGGFPRQIKRSPAGKNESVGDKNEAATQAVRKIKDKLQGYEDGTAGEQLSVEGQVRLLVSAARDRDYLSVMFPGWAPWM